MELNNKWEEYVVDLDPLQISSLGILGINA